MMQATELETVKRFVGRVLDLASAGGRPVSVNLLMGAILDELNRMEAELAEAAQAASSGPAHRD